MTITHWLDSFFSRVPLLAGPAVRSPFRKSARRPARSRFHRRRYARFSSETIAGIERLEDRTLLTTVDLFAMGLTAQEHDGVTGPVDGYFQLSRDDSVGDLTVYYQVEVTSTAESGVDYVALTGSVVITDGLFDADIAVTPIDDLLVEGDETVTVTLLSDPGYTLGFTTSDTVTILDDESTSGSGSPVFTPDWYSFNIDENSPIGTVVGTVNVSDPEGQTVSLAVDNGLGGPVPFAIDAAGTITVQGIMDYEAVPYYSLQVAGVDPDGNIGYAWVDVTLNDLVELPVVTIEATDPQGFEDRLDPGEFTVTRTGETSNPLTVFYDVLGTATPNEDYTPLSGSITIPAGSTSETISVDVWNDALTESDETVIAVLYSDITYEIGTSGSATVTIEDDETHGPSLPTVSITATDANSTESGIDTGEFTVTRTGDTTSDLTVTYEVYGSATSGEDFTALSGTVTILAGQTTATILISPIDDDVVEYDEEVVVSLLVDTTYEIGDPAFDVVTIVDDLTDSTPLVSTAGTLIAYEENLEAGEFGFARTGDTTSDLTVYFSIAGTAAAGIDYDTLPTSVVIPAGESYTSLSVNPLADSEIEGDEFVEITLSPDPAYEIGNGIGEVPIVDDDISYISVEANDPDADEKTLDPGQFTITRTGGDLNVDLMVYYTIEGTATADLDYTALTGLATILSGNSTVTVDVTPLDDSDTEGTEDVVLVLADDPGYLVDGDPAAVVNIVDTVVTVSATDPEADETGLNSGEFTFTRSGDLSADLDVFYNVSGSAFADADYTALPGSVLFLAGQSSVTVPVNTLDDEYDEGDETVTVTLLTDYTHEAGVGNSATVTILDDATDAGGKFDITITEIKGLRKNTVGDFTQETDPSKGGRLFIDTDSEVANGTIGAAKDKQRVKATAEITLPATANFQDYEVLWYSIDIDDPATHRLIDPNDGGTVSNPHGKKTEGGDNVDHLSEDADNPGFWLTEADHTARAFDHP